MMAQDVEVAPSFQPLLGLAANFLRSHESQVADPMIEAGSCKENEHMGCRGEGGPPEASDRKFTFRSNYSVIKCLEGQKSYGGKCMSRAGRTGQTER
jgi:hypothetical protein